jgi:oligosaccharide reducing-end xylanase
MAPPVHRLLLGLSLLACSPAGRPAPCTAGQVEAQADPSPPTRGSFATGRYRNLFAERGRTEAEVDQKIAAAYQQLFHGDPKDQAVCFPAGTNAQGPLAYVLDVGDGDVRSEGMSYGMMIAVELDQPADFDALWNWARTFMYHPDPRHPAYGYFSWQMRPDGTAIDEMPAPDGEAYFATALYFAAHRWGRPEYAQAATALVSHLRNRASITGPARGQGGPQTKTAGAIFHPDHAQVRFTPDQANRQSNGDYTDPSYHLPAFYELWALWGSPADRAFWTRAAQASRDLFARAAHPETGLTPDYASFDGTPKAASWDAGTATFRYDAWRTAMNWAVDYAWWAKDAREQALSDRIQRFFDGQGMLSYGNNFTLDGQRTSPDHSPGLVACNAVASLAATDSRAAKFVDGLWATAAPTGKWRYYDGMLYLMGMLHVSGRFPIHAPKA